MLVLTTKCPSNPIPVTKCIGFNSNNELINCKNNSYLIIQHNVIVVYQLAQASYLSYCNSTT